MLLPQVWQAYRSEIIFVAVSGALFFGVCLRYTNAIRMDYRGKLYAKVAGKYFDTGYHTDDWDNLISKRTANIGAAIKLIQQARSLNGAHGSDALLQDAILTLGA